ncbi:MAG: hypothetical protein B6D46_01370 [Polyangiaceae bacterium UTPRO1]|jgi:hypothetical protein|nr:CRTAC1 family protein [Myxococcales bacterium]OQY69170.1 MAG: hypothetical protein B6D46_01370 [Polyangiaceae bacterium UTPRO1]
MEGEGLLNEAAESLVAASCSSLLLAIRTKRAARACSIPVLLAVLAGACSGGAAPGTLEPPVFTDVTKSAGIERIAQTYDAAVGDFDGDGRADLFVGNHAVRAVLLHNLGDGRFVDVIENSGIATDGDKHGVAWGDFDNDGRLDLYISLGAGRGTSTKQNRLYRNEGDGHFRDVAASAGVADPNGRSRAVAWLDVDNDGWLDLLVANYASPSRLFRNLGNGTFADVSEAYGIAALPATRVTWADFDGDGWPDVLLGGTTHGIKLLHNDAGRRFVDVTQAAGLGSVGASVSGATFGDYDGDGILDLYLGYGVDFSDVVLENPGETISYAFFAGEQPVGFDFESAAKTVEGDVYENGSPHDPAKVSCGRSSHPLSSKFSCRAEDAVSDGIPEGGGLFIWRDRSSRMSYWGSSEVFSWHLRWRGPGDHHQTGVLRGGMNPVAVGFTHTLQAGGALWHGTGHGFERVAAPSLSHTANSQAVQWADINNDGTLDLYVVDSGVDGAGRPNVMFLNDGRGGFQRVDAASGASPSSGNGRGVGAEFFDLDADGRIDLFLTNGWGAPPFDRGIYHLLHNDTRPQHFLAVNLQGTVSNHAGLGTSVVIDACGRKQFRYQNGQPSFYSQSLTNLHFGLGGCQRIHRLRARWPSGTVQEVSDLLVDQMVSLIEPVKR